MADDQQIDLTSLVMEQMSPEEKAKLPAFAPKAPQTAVGAAPKKDIHSVYTDAMLSKGIQPTESQTRMNRQMVEGAMGGGLSSAAPFKAAEKVIELAPRVQSMVKKGGEALYGGLLNAKAAALKKAPTMVQDLLAARVPISPGGVAKVASQGNRGQVAALEHAMETAKQSGGFNWRDAMSAMSGFYSPKLAAPALAINRLLTHPNSGSRIAIGLNEASRLPLDQTAKGAALASKDALLSLLGQNYEEP